MKTGIFVFFLACLFVTSPVEAQEATCPGDSASAMAAIVDASQAFSRAMERRDPSTMAAQYTDDAVLLPPNGVPVTGIEAIEAFWTPGDPEFRTVRHELTTDRLEVDCDMATDLGRWRQVAKRGEGPETEAWGRYLVVWRRTADGEWKMQFDAWTRPVQEGS
ncbi:MAG: DUF4440 domain-containing protein [Gemmatimonadota bacterium]|nr:DUF4440 domain-containing protein [Gemmatimonadota bacterium]